MTIQEKQTLLQVLENLGKVHIIADEQSLSAMLWATLAIKSMTGGNETDGNANPK